MAKRRRNTRINKVLRQMEALAGGRVNDAVKLAFLDKEDLAELDKLDLAVVAEFKRSGNGVVEVKLIDRVEALERVVGLLKERQDGGASALFQALEQAAKTEGPGEDQEVFGKTEAGTELVV